MSYLICPECQNKYKTLELCPECDVQLLPPSSHNLQQHINGNGNQAIQIGGDNEGFIIIQQPTSQKESTTLIQRETITPLSIGGIPIKNWWLFVSGAIPIVANMIAIIEYWQKLPTATSTHSPYGSLLMYAMMIGVFLFISAAILQRGRYMTLPFGRTIERGNDGKLYLTKIGGTCGLCGSPVRIKTVGQKEFRQTRVTCTNNQDQHWWSFDRTVLGNVEEDFQNRQ